MRTYEVTLTNGETETVRAENTTWGVEDGEGNHPLLFIVNPHPVFGGGRAVAVYQHKEWKKVREVGHGND